MLFRDGSYLTQNQSGYADSRSPSFGSESFDDEPFLFAGLSFPIGPATPEPLYSPPPSAFERTPLPLPENPLPVDSQGRVTIPGVGDVEIVVPEGNPWMVVALSILLVAVGFFIWLWRREKKRA